MNEETKRAVMERYRLYHELQKGNVLDRLIRRNEMLMVALARKDKK